MKFTLSLPEKRSTWLLRTSEKNLQTFAKSRRGGPRASPPTGLPADEIPEAASLDATTGE